MKPNERKLIQENLDKQQAIIKSNMRLPKNQREQKAVEMAKTKTTVLKRWLTT